MQDLLDFEEEKEKKFPYVKIGVTVVLMFLLQFLIITNKLDNYIYDVLIIFSIPLIASIYLSILLNKLYINIFKPSLIVGLVIFIEFMFLFLFMGLYRNNFYPRQIEFRDIMLITLFSLIYSAVSFLILSILKKKFIFPTVCILITSIFLFVVFVQNGMS